MTRTAPFIPDTVVITEKPPTLTMRVILTKLVECDGRLSPRHHYRTGQLTGAYEIVGYRVPTWFPSWAVDGIMRRGLVDSSGKINDRGRAALEKRP